MKFDSEHLFGEVLATREVAGLKLTETQYNSHLKLPKHSHEFAYFCFVLEGNYTEIRNRRSSLCQQSALIFHPPDEGHSDQFHTSARCFNLQMNNQWFNRIYDYTKGVNYPVEFHGNSLFSNLVKRIYREFCVSDELSPIVIEGITLELIGEVFRSVLVEGFPPRWLKQVREIIHERFAEPLTITNTAEAVNIHPIHLAREFRRFYKCTFGEYIRQRRIEFACQEIIKPHSSLSEIALATGFFDQSHFTRTFKLQTGMTPKQYRTFIASH